MPTGRMMLSAPGCAMPNSAQNDSTKKFAYLNTPSTASGAATPAAQSTRRRRGQRAMPSPVRKATSVSPNIKKQNRQSHQP